MVVKDTFTGGTRTFLTGDDAQLFRKMVYAQVREGGVERTRTASCVRSCSCSRSV